MKIKTTPIKDLLVIEPEIYKDKRGHFIENYNFEQYREIIPNLQFVQDNFSISSKGVIRGLHFQRKFTQGKLVQVSLGSVFDVAVDIRKDSKTFGDWFGLVLDDRTARQFWIPPGFAHGFQVLSETAHFQYKCTDYYHPEYEETLLWNDPSLRISWHEMEETISSKDQKGLSISEIIPLEISFDS